MQFAIFSRGSPSQVTPPVNTSSRPFRSGAQVLNLFTFYLILLDSPLVVVVVVLVVVVVVVAVVVVVVLVLVVVIVVLLLLPRVCRV